MVKFQKSKDGRWYYGGYVIVDSEEYEILNKLALTWGVPEKIAAGILLRMALRQKMNCNDYVNIYKDRMKNYEEYRGNKSLNKEKDEGD